LTPTPVELPATLVPASLRDIYDIEAYEFGDPAEPNVSVAALFGFPRRERVPFVSGAGARANLEDALGVAARECMQTLGFLWGEDIPITEPECEPEPGYHQGFYLWPGGHAILRGWLAGEHGRFAGTLDRTESRRPQQLFVDLTPAEVAGRLFVAKAIAHSHIPLTFGCGHPLARARLPRHLRVHPIA
jgi:hypothetical protein